MIVAAVTIAVAFSRGRTAEGAQREAPASPSSDARGEAHPQADSHDHARREPEWRKRDEALRDALEALARRVSRLEADRHHRTPAATPNAAAESGEPPLSVHPPMPSAAAAPTTAVQPTPPATIVEPAPHARRSRDEMAMEVRRLLARGRNAVEIAQMIDVDVGEVELVLQLDRASPGRTRLPGTERGTS